MRLVPVAVALGLLGCATAGGGSSAGPGGSGAVPDSMKYGGGDGTSCEQAVVVHEKSEMAGIAAEYAWLRARYPGFQRGAQSLSKCGGRPADVIQMRTAEGRDLEITFDISEFFGAR